MTDNLEIRTEDGRLIVPKGPVVVNHVDLATGEWTRSESCAHEFAVDLDFPVIDTMPQGFTYTCRFCGRHELRFDPVERNREPK